MNVAMAKESTVSQLLLSIIIALFCSLFRQTPAPIEVDAGEHFRILTHVIRHDAEDCCLTVGVKNDELMKISINLCT